MLRLTHHENVFAGVAFIPAVVSNTPVNGVTISEPWQKGRNLALLLLIAAMTTNDALTVTVQGRKRSDGNWEAVKDKDGNNLTFTVSKTSDTGAGENGCLLGTVDLQRKYGTTYNAIRVSAVNAVAQNVVVAVAYEISHVFNAPTGQADDLLAKQVAAAATS